MRGHLFNGVIKEDRSNHSCPIFLVNQNHRPLFNPYNLSSILTTPVKLLIQRSQPTPTLVYTVTSSSLIFLAFNTTNYSFLKFSFLGGAGGRGEDVTFTLFFSLSSSLQSSCSSSFCLLQKVQAQDRESISCSPRRVDGEVLVRVQRPKNQER